jgi:GNAT superfamily N-acetyltransferase
MSEKQTGNFYITALGGGNAEAFLPMLPRAARAWLTAPAGAVVGAADSGTNTAAGVCAAHMEEGLLEIDWIWVAEDMRRKGAAWQLLMSLIRVSAGIPEVIGLSVRYPAEGGDALTALFQRLGFAIEDGAMDGFHEKLSVLRQNSFFSRPPTDIALVKPLKAVGAGLRTAFSRHIEALPDGAAVELPIAWEEYDGDLSMLYVKDDAVHGAVLMRRLSADALELAFAYAQNGMPAAFASALYAVAEAGAAACPPDTDVSIIALTDASRNLAEKLIPGAAPIPVKQGVRYF